MCGTCRPPAQELRWEATPSTGARPTSRHRCRGNPTGSPGPGHLEHGRENVSVAPVVSLLRPEALAGETASTEQPTESITTVPRELVLAAVSEQGSVATWVAGPRGLKTVSAAAAGMLGLAEGAIELEP